MKFILTLLLVAFASLSINAQEARTKDGFISITLGAAFPTGDFGDDNEGQAENGLGINLVNFGYLFSKNIGITAMLSGSAYPIDNASNNDPTWGFGTLMVGPLFSFGTEDNKAEFDFRFMVGSSSLSLDPDDGSGSQEGSGGAFSIGSGIRYNLSDLIALTSNLDYVTGNPEFDTPVGTFDLNVTTVNLTFGISFRLK